MLFLYRPPQTYMPYAAPRSPMRQDEYRWQMQEAFDATRRVAPPVPAAAPRDAVTKLKDAAALHEAGVLTDEEFAAAKAKVLAEDSRP
jgi:putative oligomerization/nucleic acid binding protein